MITPCAVINNKNYKIIQFKNIIRMIIVIKIGRSYPVVYLEFKLLGIY